MSKVRTGQDGVIQVHEFISWLFEQKPRWKLETIVEGDEKRMQATFFNDFKETKFFAIFASGSVSQTTSKLFEHAFMSFRPSE